MKLTLWAIVDEHGQLQGDGESFWIFQKRARAVEVLGEICEERYCRIVKVESKSFKVSR